MRKYFHAKQIMLQNQMIEDAYLIVEDGKFVDVSTLKPTDSDIIDYGDAIIAPGLVDTHIHGYLGQDVMDNQTEGLDRISEGLLSCGVTSWLPTTLTASVEQLNAVCQTIGQHYNRVKGAKIRGIFLEGPYFTEKYKGAQNPAYMGDPSIEQLTKWQELSNGLVKKIAIAPEREGVEAFIKSATAQGIYTALGHSDATYQQAQAAVNAGASIFVHTFNGMSGLHHREPGMVGAALNLDDIFAELICDGHHVHPAAAQIVTTMRGKDGTVLITDCMRAGGLGDGESSLGEFAVTVENGTARLKESGNLAGSILELKQAVKHVVGWGIASPAEAIQMASFTPAKSVGIDHECGQIKAGLAADFIVLNPQMDLLATYLDGELKYEV